MAGVKTIRIEADGTDLTLSVAGRTWINSDGRRNMPSGEIFTGPIEDSAPGPPALRLSRLPRRPRARGDQPRVRARARSSRPAPTEGEDYLLAMLELDPGARRLGELGLGLNSGIDRFTGSILYDEKIGGTVHLALGQSYPETGGTQPVGPALGPDRRHQNRRPDHGRRPARHGKRTVAGGLAPTHEPRNRRLEDATCLESRDLHRPRSLHRARFVCCCLAGHSIALAPALGQATAMRPCATGCFSSSTASTRRPRQAQDAAPGELDQARAQDPAALARPGDGQDRRAQERLEKIRAALQGHGAGRQHRREPRSRSRARESG